MVSMPLLDMSFELYTLFSLQLLPKQLLSQHIQSIMAFYVVFVWEENKEQKRKQTMLRGISGDHSSTYLLIEV